MRPPLKKTIIYQHKIKIHVFFFTSETKYEDLLSQAIKTVDDKQCPNRLSGAARKKLVLIKKKKQSEMTEEDKRFLEYAEFTRKAREDYFKNINVSRYEHGMLQDA